MAEIERKGPAYDVVRRRVTLPERLKMLHGTFLAGSRWIPTSLLAIYAALVTAAFSLFAWRAALVISVVIVFAFVMGPMLAKSQAALFPDYKTVFARRARNPKPVDPQQAATRRRRELVGAAVMVLLTALILGGLLYMKT